MIGSDNYGNSLQNYAVQELIRFLGYEAYTLNNQTRNGFPNNARKPIPLYKKLAPAHLMAYRRTKLNHRFGCKNSRDCYGTGLRKVKRDKEAIYEAKQNRAERFAAFNQQFICFDEVPIDSRRFDKEHLKDYYAFVCGSDQVWNPYFHTNSMIEFLQFAPEQKRIAFAPSFGISEIPQTRVADYASWLRSIPQLSVREDSGAKIIRDLTGRDAPVLLDPTLGIPKERWLSFARKPKTVPKGDYVFCYFLGNKTNKYCKWIEAYAQKYDCEIVDVWDIHDLRYYAVDPTEFVWLIANAKAVFTDSFHGTAFSINLQVPFLSFERVEGGASMSSRITSLLQKAGLESCRCVSRSSFDHLNTDFTEAEKRISDERKTMLAYLSSALRSVETAKKLPLLANRYHCTGCGGCAAACPTGALRMTADAEGFYYPVVDSEKCIGCGICEKACPSDLNPQRNEPLPRVYAAYAKEPTIVNVSSSGGVFSVIARDILKHGGVVFGAGYDAEFNVCHQEIQDETEIEKLRTSKYVQSDMADIFRTVKERLREGKKVFFTGTPCQIAALKQHLGTEEDNLLTADIICHGVPSPKVWKQYLQQCHGGKRPQKISFRDKSRGWNQFSMRIDYDDGTSYCEPAVKDPYERAFLANLTLRPSCYQCQYKTANRVSDLTFADYWGVETVHPDLKEQQGVSMLIVHSQRGDAVFQEVKEELHILESDAKRALGLNHAALHSVNWHPKRNLFFAKMESADFSALVDQCLKQPVSKRLRRVIVRYGSKVKRGTYKLLHK